MGSIDLANEPEFRRYINARLKRRGLTILYNDWEIHGPHPGMDYQILLGWAYDPKDKPRIKMYLAMYPRKVYWIEPQRDCWKVNKEDIIPVLKGMELAKANFELAKIGQGKKITRRTG